MTTTVFYIILRILLEIAFLLSFHWFADYTMQKGGWAVAKSKSVLALLKHTITYTMLWSIPTTIYCMWFGYSFVNGFYFLLITFIAHTLTDYFTSKYTSKQYEKQNWGGDSLPRGFDFFVMLGFDQLLHQLQLIFTFVLFFYFLTYIS